MSAKAWFQRLLGSLKGASAEAAPTRWIMLDVETSGLDPRNDRLLAIAAVGMQVNWASGTIQVNIGDSFEVVLRQEEVSTKENILLHGIGAERQRQGIDPRLAMEAFMHFAGGAPLLAFHAAFDQALITRYFHKHLDTQLANDWLDIDHLCAVTYEKVRARALDDWLDHFGIHCAVRHQAAADTLAECELLQRIWPRVAPQCNNWRDVQRLANQHRWIQRAQ